MADAAQPLSRVTTAAASLGAWAALVAVAAVPFALGGGPGWGWGTAAGVLGVALVLEGTRGTVSPSPAVADAACVHTACAALLGEVALTLAQAVPGLPGAHPVWTELGAALPGAPPPGTWSRTPAAALPNALLVASVAAALWLGARAPASLRAHGPVVLAGAAALASGYGLLVLQAGSEQVLWLPKPAYRDAATGPFVNRNAFAAFAGVGLLALVAAAGVQVRRGRAPWWWALPVGALILAGLGASASRGGIAATLIALACLGTIAAWRDGRRVVRLGAAVGLGAMSAAAAAALAPRLAGVPEALAKRAAIHRMALEAIAERPWLGHGAGASDAVFRAARPADLAYAVTQAHSIYLEAALAWGVPAAALLVAAAAGLAVASARRAWGGDPRGAAALGCCILLGAHGLIDFAPQVPGVALPAAWLIGAGAAPVPRSPP